MKTVARIQSLKIIDWERPDGNLRLEDDELGAICDLTTVDARALGQAFLRAGGDDTRSHGEISNQMALLGVERSRALNLGDEHEAELITQKILALHWALGSDPGMVWDRKETGDVEVLYVFHEKEGRLYQSVKDATGLISDWAPVEDSSEIVRARAQDVLDAALRSIKRLGLHILGTEGGESGGYTTNELEPGGSGYVILTKEEL